MNTTDRRNFIKASVFGGIALSMPFPMDTFGNSELKVPEQARVCISTGDDRADMAFRALQPFAREIKQSIGNRQVILKPNNNDLNVPLAGTHADTLEGVLEFLKSIRKLDNVVIAESGANGPTFEGFAKFGYFNLADKYPVKFVDFDKEDYEVLHVFDETDCRPHPIKIAKMMLNPDSFIVSVARFKTHDRVVATLSLKNVVFGSPIKDSNFNWSHFGKGDITSQKPILHGGGYRGTNYNLYALAPKIHPHLALIDGFEGMEGNGPSGGSSLDHRVCVAGTDWLAADRVAVELMGIDFSIIGYLNFCAQTGMGVADLDKIEIIGERISDHIRHYKLHENIQDQLVWMKPISG